MQIIPLQPTQNQTLTVLLGNQNCRINVYQKFYGLFIDLTVDARPVLAGVICQHANRIVRYSYLGFVGDLAFFDTQGKADPRFDGLGGRYQLVYIEPSDLVTP
jgi:hypothetical protein